MAFTILSIILHFNYIKIKKKELKLALIINFYFYRKLNFILNLISSSNLPNDSEFYIGGLYGQVGYEESSSFEWSVGSNQIYTWTNWDTGEPVNTTNGVIYMTSTGKWKTDTYDTDVKRYYIIEHKFNKISD